MLPNNWLGKIRRVAGQPVCNIIAKRKAATIPDSTMSIFFFSAAVVLFACHDSSAERVMTCGRLRTFLNSYFCMDDG